MKAVKFIAVWFGLFSLLVSAQSACAVFYLTDGKTIYQARDDGSNTTAIVEDLSDVKNLQLAGNRLFWIEKNSGSWKIRSDAIDGNPADLIAAGEPVDIAVDSAGNRLYWTDAIYLKIFSSDLNGENILEIAAINTAGNIAVDVESGKLYWTDTDAVGSRVIRSSNLDGSSALDLTTPGQPIGSSDMVVDHKGGRIYSFEPYRGYMHSLATGKTTQILSGGGYMIGGSKLAIDEKRRVLYMTDWNRLYLWAFSLGNDGYINVIDFIYFPFSNYYEVFSGIAWVEENSTALNITLNPPEGGTVVSDPSGIDCRGDCTESFNQGAQVTLTAMPNEGWTFEDWDDGKAIYTDNPITVTMDGDKTLTARFVPQYNPLESTDTSPLGNRTPLILVHGNNSEKRTKTNYRWENYIKHFSGPSVSNLGGKYKVYLFKWDSTKNNLYNGLALGAAIDSVPELDNKEIVFLAHSRGGIIARYFMNRYTARNGIYAGRLGGEKTKYLVTLATPHRGSPGADPIWNEFSFDYNHNYFDAMLLYNIYYLPHVDFFKDSYRFLLWDDVNDELKNNEVCWDSALLGDNYCFPLLSNGTDLLTLNLNEGYMNKIIAFGSNRFGGNSINSKDLAQLAKLCISPFMILVDHSHPLLSISSKLLAEMPVISNYYHYPEDFIYKDYCPFRANDGMVPLASALFLDAGNQNVFKVNRRGKLIYNGKEVKHTTNVAESHLKESIIISGKVDHLDFLDDGRIISMVINKLNSL